MLSFFSIFWYNKTWVDFDSFDGGFEDIIKNNRLMKIWGFGRGFVLLEVVKMI